MTNRNRVRHSFEADPGLFTSVLERLMEASAALKIPPALLDHLSEDSEGEALAEMILRTLQLRAPLSEPLPPDHYLIQVNRGPFPPEEVLQQAFSRAYHFDLFRKGCDHSWYPHSTRRIVNLATATKVVAYAHPIEQIMPLEEAISIGVELGYLPADRHEAYSFGTDPQTRDVQRAHRVRAAGSIFCSSLSDGPKSVVLDAHHDTRNFRATDCNHLLHPGDCILLVKQYLDQPKGSHIVPHNPRAFVTVPDCDIDDLTRRVGKFADPTRYGQDFADLLRKEQRSSKRCKRESFRVREVVTGPDEQLIEAYRSLTHQNFHGRVAAFLEWCLTHEPAGVFAVFLSDQDCRPGDLQPAAITYSNQPDCPTEFIYQPPSYNHSWNCTVVGFQTIP